MEEKVKETNSRQTKKKASFIFLFIVQLVFYGSIILPIYALLTFNYTIIITLIAIMLLQIPIKRSAFCVNLVTKYMHPARYFQNFDIIQDAGIPSSQKCIFPFHPHSVFAMGVLASMNYPNKPYFGSLVGLSSNFILNVPIMGALIKLWGVGSASSQSVKSLMKEGKNIGLLPGGFQQATITSQKEMRCWITHRKGFIKYALQNDYTICPVIILGQHQAFWTFEAFEGVRLLANKIKIPGVIFWNKLSGTFIPTNVSITVITGKSIIRKGMYKGKPSKEEIDQVHGEYTEEIERLYTKYKNLNKGLPLKFY